MNGSVRQMNTIEPTLIVSKNLVLKNINKIKNKAEKNRIRFRPHFKTHQSVEIGEWLRVLGVNCITVSSVRMAECFAKAGWTDITIAIPVNILEIEKINELAKKVQLNLLIESIETVRTLEEKLKHSVEVWINIDTGYHRDGIEWNETYKIIQIATHIHNAKNMHLTGILTHAGHSYKARNRTEIIAVHEDTINKMVQLQEEFKREGYNNLQISVGDTPTSSVADDFSLVDEIRPGNFVFYDLKQVQIGSCTEEEIAIRLACPVIAKYDERKEILVDGGAIHLSKDFILDKGGRTIYGYISQSLENEFSKVKDTYVSAISQEHGTIKTNNNNFFQRTNIGDIIYIIPVHACLTTNSMSKLKTLSGKEIQATCK